MEMTSQMERTRMKRGRKRSLMMERNQESQSE